MRDNRSLVKMTRILWRKYFSNIPIKNNILVFFSRHNKRVLGSIKYDRQKRTTSIRLNGYFQDETIPLYVVIATLAHEMAHYAHGFSSPRRRLYRYPHEGGIVRRELLQRNLGILEKASRKWLKENWMNYLKLQDKT